MKAPQFHPPFSFNNKQAVPLVSNLRRGFLDGWCPPRTTWRTLTGQALSLPTTTKFTWAASTTEQITPTDQARTVPECGRLAWGPATHQLLAVNGTIGHTLCGFL